MESPIISILKEFGLEPKEVDIYLAVLRLGKATISDIARESKVKRTTIYEYADKLTKENLFHKTAKGRQVFYVAENPAKLAKILERKHKKLVSIMPELQQIYASSTHKPRMRYYEGIEGLRTIYLEMTSTSQVIYSIFSTEKFLSLFAQGNMETFLNNLYEHGGEIKDLVERNDAAKKYASSDVYKKIGKAKILPNYFDVPVDLMVSGDKVSMISYVNRVGVIIENPEIAELQRVMIKFIRRNV